MTGTSSGRRGNHLDERYHEELSRLGAKLAGLALHERKLFAWRKE
jgi:hypothetical protein